MNHSLVRLTALAWLGACASASAADLGTRGHTYEIAEPDFRARIMADVAEVDQAAVTRDLTDKAMAHTKRLPATGLPGVTSLRTDYTDLSVTLARDVFAPVKQPDGRYKQTLLAAKGTRLNPLSQLAPLTGLLFVDARDPAQLAFLDEVMTWDPAGIQPVITAGDPGALAKQRKRPIFFAQPWMIERFKVKHLPALIQAAVGTRKGLLASTYFPRPFQLSDVRSVWTPKLSATSAKKLTSCLTPPCATSGTSPAP